MNYIRHVQRKRTTRNAGLGGGALSFRSDGDATGQQPQTRDRLLGDCTQKRELFSKETKNWVKR